MSSPGVPQITVGTFAQKRAGAGDVDECAPASDMAGIHATAPWLELPTFAGYRAAAGNPDDPDHPDGLTLEQSAAAIAQLWPALVTLEGYQVSRKGAPGWIGPDATIAAALAGQVAIVSVLGAALPARLRYGFGGRHRCAVALARGGLQLHQPLAPAFSPWQPVTVAELREAIARYPGDGLGGVILLPTPAAALRTHPGVVTLVAELERIRGIIAAIAELVA